MAIKLNHQFNIMTLESFHLTDKQLTRRNDFRLLNNLTAFYSLIHLTENP